MLIQRADNCYYLINEQGDKVIQEYVRKHSTKSLWAVFSEKGKKLSRWYKSKKMATDRLKEIEVFKHIG